MDFTSRVLMNSPDNLMYQAGRMIGLANIDPKKIAGTKFHPTVDSLVEALEHERSEGVVIDINNSEFQRGYIEGLEHRSKSNGVDEQGHFVMPSGEYFALKTDSHNSPSGIQAGKLCWNQPITVPPNIGFQTLEYLPDSSIYQGHVIDIEPYTQPVSEEAPTDGEPVTEELDPEKLLSDKE